MVNGEGTMPDVQLKLRAGRRAMSDLGKLTDRQRQIYDFICEHIEDKGYPPTVRDIGLHFKIQSPNGVMCHLNALQKKGLINRKDKSARAINLVNPPRKPSE